MSKNITKGKGLQIESEANFFSETFLKTQRIGFSIMILLIVVSLLGLFGSGFLSHTKKSQGNLTITYEKFIRKQASTLINIDLNNPCDTENILAISKQFFEKISIKSISPLPFKEVSSNNFVQYHFLCNRSFNGISVVLVIEPEKFGLLQESIEMNNDKVTVTQFVYP